MGDKDIGAFASDMLLLARTLKENDDDYSVQELTDYYMQYDKEQIVLMWFVTVLLLDDMTIQTSEGVVN